MSQIRIGLAVMVLLTQCQCVSSEKSATAPKLSWQGKMYSLSNNLADILSLTSTPIKTENNKALKKRYIKVTAELAQLAQGVAEDHQAPDQDPSLKFIAKRFAEDSFKARQLAQLGHLDGSKYLLRQTTSYCVSCHSRSPQGIQNTNIPLPNSLKKESGHKKAQFYAATRQFQEAIREYQIALGSKSLLETDPSLWEEEAEKFLALVLRVKKDPKLGKTSLDHFLSTLTFPSYLQRKVTTWSQSLAQWEKESKNSSQKRTSTVLLKRAATAIKTGAKLEPITTDRSGMVEFLKASSLLHEILKAPKSRDQVYGKALFLAGQMSEHLKSLSLWTMHEAYYEACIRYQPFTKLAKRCYLRLEELKLSSKSYWSGQGVTQETRQHLFELKNLVEKRSWKAITTPTGLGEIEE